MGSLVSRTMPLLWVENVYLDGKASNQDVCLTLFYFGFDLGRYFVFKPGQG
jgi:hypothetical protein